jgi:NAD(P)-dependent dehydrogenase (short-subunit alcohol dehydrogenase family)
MSSPSAEYFERRVLLAGRGSRLLPMLAVELQTQGAVVVLADPAAPEDLRVPDGIATTRGPLSTIRAAIERLGGLDVLVCHTGPGSPGPVLDVDARTWRAELDALVGDAFEFSQVAAQVMVKSGGVIVHIVGADALHAYSGRSMAATSHAAVVGMIRALAVELAAHDIRVVGVIHGPIEGGPVGAATMTTGDGARATHVRSPNGRLATAVDVAAAVRFVAGPRSSFMTGQAIRVDGGWASLNQAPAGMNFP